MASATSTLKLRNRAQADLKFACLKLRKALGGTRLPASVSIEEWETDFKSISKIGSLIEAGVLEASVVREYGVEALMQEIASKVTGFVSGLKDVQGEMSKEDEERFQVTAKLRLAEAVIEGAYVVVNNVGILFQAGREERKEWEAQNPRLAEQEKELKIYEKTLRDLLLGKDGLDKVGKGEWLQAEGCLKSLELYLLEHKIDHQRVKKAKLEGILRDLLGKFEALDKKIANRGAFDADTAEKVWGLVDKLGSGLAWLARSERLWVDEEPKPTTRSTFLLKSAPPAKVAFSKDKSAWHGKELVRFRERISLTLLDKDNPIKAVHEQRWSSAYKELEALQTFLKENKAQASSVQASKLPAALRDVERRIGDLHTERGPEADTGMGDYTLMYVTWELTMRLSKHFDDMGVR